MSEPQETEIGVEGRGRGIFDYDLFRQNLERTLRMGLDYKPREPEPPTIGDWVSYAVYAAALFVGYFLAFLPAHLIRGLWAGVCGAWERAGE